jgi:hypothetical protein
LARTALFPARYFGDSIFVGQIQPRMRNWRRVFVHTAGFSHDETNNIDIYISNFKNK